VLQAAVDALLQAQHHQQHQDDDGYEEEEEKKEDPLEEAYGQASTSMAPWFLVPDTEEGGEAIAETLVSAGRTLE